MAARPEDFDAEEPEVAEYDAVRGRQQIGDLEGCAQLVALLDSDEPPVLRDAANALYNLALFQPNADSLLQLGGLPKLCGGLEHMDSTVRAAMAGVLMNCAGRTTAASAAAASRISTIIATSSVDASALGTCLFFARCC